MQIHVIRGGIQEQAVDAIIVNLFEGTAVPSGATAAVDQELGGAIGDLIQSGDLTGRSGEVVVLYPRQALPAKRVLVTGLGKPDKFNLDAVRKATAVGVKKARDLNARSLAMVVHGAGVGGLSTSAAAQATAEGALLALYQYDAPKKKTDPAKQIDSLALVEVDENKVADIESAVQIAQAVFAGVSLARDLVNMPPNVATPTRLAQAAGEIAQAASMELFVGDRAWAAEKGMGAFLGVAQGADEPPRFIVLEHNAGRSDLDTVVLVGKGITFDSGGISIKPSEGMGEMKSDMAGAAAVLGAMKVVSLLDLPLHVIGITPATENMPGGNAYRPADVVTASNGKTIEIISTDAEGRLILADALVYAQQYQPKAVVDLATLTGACVVALGKNQAAGLFCNDDSLRDRLVASSQATAERLWPLPLYEEYRQSIRSEVADMKNSGGRNGGVGTSAVFLQEFTDYPWAHLDIAGMALMDKEGPYNPPGATGFGVRLLVDFLRSWKS